MKKTELLEMLLVERHLPLPPHPYQPTRPGWEPVLRPWTDAEIRSHQMTLLDALDGVGSGPA